MKFEEHWQEDLPVAHGDTWNGSYPELPMNEEHPSRGPARALWPVAAVLGVFLAAALPLILSGVTLGPYAWDQLNYHEKVVRTFESQWPRPDVSNYLSATTPLYHLILAMVARFVSDSSVVLQLVGSLFTLGLLATLTLALARTTTALRVFVLAIVPVCSLYIFTGGVWMLPDNAAWWCVLGIVLIAWRCRFDATLVVGGGALLAVLVLLRQSHLWAAAVLWTSAWMSLDAKQAVPHQKWRSPVATPARPDGVSRSTLEHVLTDPWRRAARTLLMVLATCPAFAIVLWFREVWDGRLYPPAFDIQLYYPHNPAIPVFIVAVFGAINIAFAGYLLPRLAVLWRHAKGPAILLLVASVVLASLPATTTSNPDGRFGGLWSIAAKFPTIADRSPLIIALAVWGAFAVVGWCAALSRGPRLVVLATLAAFIASQSIGHLAFQRYCEPLLLMLTLLLAARTPEWPGAKWMHPMKVAGPAVLGLALAAYTAGKLSHDVVARDEGVTLDNVPPLIDHVPPPPRPPRRK